MFGTKIRALAFGDLEILSDLGRDIHTYGQKSAKKFLFLGVFRNQRVMKRGEMQKKIFRFLDRLPYVSFYRTIVLNVKVKIVALVLRAIFITVAAKILSLSDAASQLG